MKTLRNLGLLAATSIALLVPASANASIDPSTYTLEASQSLTPKKGSFFTNAFKSANWGITVSAAAANPPNTIILPNRNTTLNLAPNSQLTFNPPATMPVCPDDQIGAGTNNSVGIPVAVSRCPNSVIGNGTARFALAKNNTNPNLSRFGVLLAFNGGRVNGLPRLKFWAYSYETTTGVYTEGVLQPDGTLDIPFPQLSEDSALTQLVLNMPGKAETIDIPQLGESVVLPAGQAPDYIRAKCDSQAFAFSADFLLGQRDLAEQPFGDTLQINDIGEPTPCTGVRATAKLAKPTIKGPAKAKRGKVATYRVTVRNSGGLPVTGVRLRVSGKGVSINTSVGTIAGESSKTVRVKAKFRSAGRVKATFLATSKNGGKQSATKTIRVG